MSSAQFLDGTQLLVKQSKRKTRVTLSTDSFLKVGTLKDCCYVFSYMPLAKTSLNTPFIKESIDFTLCSAIIPTAAMSIINLK